MKSLSISRELMQSTGMNESELLLEIGVMLFQRSKLTLAQAAKLADMPRLQFQQLLASRQIPIHYDVDDLEQDIQTLKDLDRL